MATRPWQQCDFPNNLYQALKSISIMTASPRESAFRITDALWGASNTPVGLIKMSSNGELYVFILVSLKKTLDKQLSCRWYDTQWRWYDVIVMHCIIVPLGGWRCLNTNDNVLGNGFTEDIIISHYSDATWAPWNMRSSTLPLTTEWLIYLATIDHCNQQCWQLWSPVGAAPAFIGHIALQWHHNWCDGISNHRHVHCLLNCLLRGRSKRTSNLHVTDLCERNSPVTGEFRAKASDAENISIRWRHHG